MTSIRPRIRSLTLERYRAFEHADIELGRITLLLGRNNAGKSALCFAPLYFAQAFRAEAQAPLVSAASDLDFGSPQSAFFRRAATGTEVRFGLEDAGGLSGVRLGATVHAEEHNRQLITRFETEETEANRISLKVADKPTWRRLRNEISRRPGLANLASEVSGLRGVRPLPPGEYDYLGYTPTNVGFYGQNAASMLLEAGDDGLAAVNRWFGKLGVKLSIRRKSERFEVRAAGPAHEPVLLPASGAGLAQLLPLIVQLELAELMPRLWCVEQPELHLHPGAHALVAQALVERAIREPLQRFLIETHSDAFVLRVRRAVAEGSLSPKDVRIYFVDESSDERPGSIPKPIALNEDATPDWWPQGVFAEPEEEYFAIRRALERRRAQAQ